MKYTSFAANTFTGIENAPFSPHDYSRLKFGSDHVARAFGHELADAFFAAHVDALLANHVVVIPSPYNFVENAATVMTKHFVDRLNELLVEAKGESVEYLTIQRKVSYINDYGFLSKEKRKGLLDNDRFYVNKEFVRGKLLIFIDDVKITGTHEDKLKEVLADRKIRNDAMFLYFAEYLGSQAEIEAQLNFSGIQNLDDYCALMNEPNHHIIVRPIKFLLSQPVEALKSFLDRAPYEKVKKLYFSALGEGYYRIPAYQKTFALVKSVATSSIRNDD